MRWSRRWIGPVAMFLAAQVLAPHGSPMAASALEVGSGPATLPGGRTCDGPDADPWVLEMARRLLEGDGLLRFAGSEFGQVLSCEGRIHEFDGFTFGTVAFELEGGAVFEFETMPPAVRRSVLRHPYGFGEEERVLEATRAYASGLGLDIEWEDPERASGDGLLTEQYWDPDPGLNGSVLLARRGEVLVSVTVTMAP
ncbi:MAG: hypothetical protein OEO23_06640 [Gemmatimonadota bacterium]|nr:hypothetical protein [Gemmatimonadota bacterium]